MKEFLAKLFLAASAIFVMSVVAYAITKTVMPDNLAKAIDRGTIELSGGPNFKVAALGMEFGIQSRDERSITIQRVIINNKDIDISAWTPHEVTLQNPHYVSPPGDYRPDPISEGLLCPDVAQRAQCNQQQRDRRWLNTRPDPNLKKRSIFLPR